MIEVTLRDNTQASFDKALRKFKKLCKDDGFIEELKERKYFKSESQKKREQKRKREWEHGKKI